MIFPTEIQEFLQKYDRFLLDERGIIKLQSVDFYKTLDYTNLRVWCVCRAIYLIPTIELVEWLKANFNLDRAIEIGWFLEVNIQRKTVFVCGTTINNSFSTARKGK